MNIANHVWKERLWSRQRRLVLGYLEIRPKEHDHQCRKRSQRNTGLRREGKRLGRPRLVINRDRLAELEFERIAGAFGVSAASIHRMLKTYHNRTKHKLL